MKKRKTSSSKDFDITCLPHNRFEVFLDLIKANWRYILLIGLFLFLGFLPLIASLAISSIMKNALYSSFAAGNIEERAYRSQYFMLCLSFNAVDYFLLLIIAVPLSGTMNIYRLLNYYEMMIFKTDFIKGIKQNISEVLKLFLIYGFIFYLSKTIFDYFLLAGTSDFLATILYGLPLSLFALLLIGPMCFSLCSVPIYSNKFSMTLRNGFLLYFPSIFKSLLFELIMFGPLIILFFNNFYAILITVSIYSLAYLPISMLIYFIFSNSVFDKHINITSYPELVDKGIYRIKK